MELAGALQLGELAAAFAALPVFPLFDTAYFIVSVLYLKYEPGECGPALLAARPGPVRAWVRRGEPAAASEIAPSVSAGGGPDRAGLGLNRLLTGGE